VRLHVLVEGQTEETVLRDVLQPHFEGVGWYVSHSLVKTKRPASGPMHKGGITNWPQVEREIQLLLRDSSITVLTTLFDYYAFPPECPGMSDRPPKDVYDRVHHVESALATAINNRRFRPNLVLHELEAWVFAAAEQLGEFLGDELATRLRADVAEAGGPELVNDSPATAPSKRLLGYLPTYMKTTDGPLAIDALGLTGLRAQCPHFDAWLRDLEALAVVA
jgi:hypothetical protein